MGIYQYNTEQLKLLTNIYCGLAQIEEPDLNIQVFVQWLSQENQAKKYLKILRWEYGMYKGERVDECTDIQYLKTRLTYAPAGTPYRKCIEETLSKLLEQLT